MIVKVDRTLKITFSELEIILNDYLDKPNSRIVIQVKDYKVDYLTAESAFYFYIVAMEKDGVNLLADKHIELAAMVKPNAS